MPEFEKQQIPSSPEASPADAVSAVDITPELEPSKGRWSSVLLRTLIASELAFLSVVDVELADVASPPVHTISVAHEPRAEQPLRKLPANQSLQTCPADDPRALRTAQKIMSKPQSPYIERVWQKLLPAAEAKPLGFLMEPPAGPAIDDYKGQWMINKEAAQKDGVTVVNELPYIKPLLNDIYGNSDIFEPTLPFDIYFHQAKTFLAQYGVNLRIGKGNEQYSYDSVAPTNKDLNTETAKNDLLNIINGQAELPKEFTKLTGLKQVVLVAHSQGAAAYANMAGKHDSIFINVSDDLDRNAVVHEEGHLADAAMCGGWAGAYNDPTFTAPNPNNFYTNDQPSRHVVELPKDVVNFTGKTFKIKEGVITAKSKSDFSKAATLIAKLNAEGRSVASTSDYGSTAIAEDKAELTKVLFNPNAFPELTEPDTPRLNEKTDILLGRIYQYAPGVASYIGDVGVHDMYAPILKDASTPLPPSLLEALTHTDK